MPKPKVDIEMLVNNPDALARLSDDELVSVFLHQDEAGWTLLGDAAYYSSDEKYKNTHAPIVAALYRLPQHILVKVLSFTIDNFGITFQAFSKDSYLAKPLMDFICKQSLEVKRVFINSKVKYDGGRNFLYYNFHRDPSVSVLTAIFDFMTELGNDACQDLLDNDNHYRYNRAWLIYYATVNGSKDAIVTLLALGLAPLDAGAFQNLKAEKNGAQLLKKYQESVELYESLKRFHHQLGIFNAPTVSETSTSAVAASSSSSGATGFFQHKGPEAESPEIEKVYEEYPQK